MFWIGMMVGLFIGVAAGIFLAALGRVSAEAQGVQQLYDSRFAPRRKMMGEMCDDLKTESPAG